MCPADLRADLTELELPNTMTTHFPDPSDVLNFNLTITPDEGGSACVVRCGAVPCRGMARVMFLCDG